MAGIEPATDGLRNRCSTAELHWHPDAWKVSNPHSKALQRRRLLYTCEGFVASSLAMQRWSEFGAP